MNWPKGLSRIDQQQASGNLFACKASAQSNTVKFIILRADYSHNN
jgi:hypothetical protein